jgi:prepilin-type N-terminal cleavage/methylation domain-containing protein
MGLKKELKNKGFTLIELVITLFILVLLGLGMNMSVTYWGNSAKVASTKGILQEAYMRTSALAVRNPNAVFGTGSPSATMSYNSTTGVISICSGAAGCTKPVWNATVPKNINLLIGFQTAPSGSTNASGCVSMNSQGTLLTSNSCTNTPFYIITLTGITGTSSGGKVVYGYL